MKPTKSDPLGAAVNILGHAAKVAVACIESRAKSSEKLIPAPLPPGLWFKLADASMAQDVVALLHGAGVESDRLGCWVGCAVQYERSLPHLMQVVLGGSGVRLLAFNRVDR